MAKSGITAAGNWIVDKTKVIDDFPPQDGLANILYETAANGGSPYNILKDLYHLGAEFPLQAIGTIGNDDAGQFILEDCARHAIDGQYLKTVTETGTSFTDVMTSKATGRRTFFHYRGANAVLDREHFPVDRLDCKIFHLGYLLLLDKLDQIDSKGKTGASRILDAVQQKGIKTAVDIVSENSDRFQQVVKPSLPFIDYLFVNEYEASKITGIDADPAQVDSLFTAAEALIESGVKEVVFLHASDGAIALTKDGKRVIQGRIQYPKELIKGASGAGDAFAAGVLFGLHEGFSIEKCLQLGVGAAASSLSEPTCSDSVVKAQEAMALGEKYDYLKW
ncbi:carbohydrate kinase family protein [Persicobacter psychrovividus]|uniref:Adenosine kinase n=1 Tax=Persicobacter psychrovividus TaxID=387638 RepID=A0ABN6LDK3_9BACT|nr:adenosine kinase [Persicobacter psychrovividus]